MGGWGHEVWEMPKLKPKPRRVVEPDPQTPDPQFPDEGDGTTDQMRSLYTNLRFECAELEMLIERGEKRGLLTEKELKRLDKAVTVMKVGFKILKKVARHAPKGADNEKAQASRRRTDGGSGTGAADRQEEGGRAHAAGGERDTEGHELRTKLHQGGDATAERGVR